MESRTTRPRASVELPGFEHLLPWHPRRGLIPTGTPFPLAGSTAGQKITPEFRGRRRRSEFHAALRVFHRFKHLQNPPEQLLIEAARAWGSSGGSRCSWSSQGLKQIGERQSPAMRAHFTQKKFQQTISASPGKLLRPWRAISVWFRPQGRKPSSFYTGSEMDFSQGTKSLFFPPSFGFIHIQFY